MVLRVNTRESRSPPGLQRTDYKQSRQFTSSEAHPREGGHTETKSPVLPRGAFCFARARRTFSAPAVALSLRSIGAGSRRKRKAEVGDGQQGTAQQSREEEAQAGQEEDGGAGIALCRSGAEGQVRPATAAASGFQEIEFYR